MEKRKKKWGKSQYLCLLLVIAGILCFSVPMISNYLYTLKYSDMMSEYETNSKNKDYSTEWALADAYNATLLEKKNQFVVTEEEQAYVDTLLNPYGTGMIGYVEIPSIDVYLPIFHGTEEKVLQSGSGLLYGSSLPTGGESTHSVITAHNGLIKAKMFTDIGQLVAGDMFYLHVLDRVLAFEVSESYVVDPEDFSLITVEEGKTYTTLYTCTPYGVNSHRLLVRGVLVENERGDVS